jgi:hypothetical protein
MRDQIKKQLLKALHCGTQIEDSKRTAEQLSTEIEGFAFELTGKNAKNKAYRERTKKVINRLKGNRNQTVRTVLKKGVLSVEDFTKLSDKEIDDDSFFIKFGEEVSFSNPKGVKIFTKPPKMPVISANLNLIKGNRFVYI